MPKKQHKQQSEQTDSPQHERTEPSQPAQSQTPQPQVATSCTPKNAHKTDRPHTYILILQTITTIAALAAIFVAWFKIGDATEGIRELVNAQSQKVLDRVEIFSPDMVDRRYLVHEFGGNTFVLIKERKMNTATGTRASRRTLHIACKKWGEGAYGGVNFFGNEAITGRFVPINLAGVSSLSFEFLYPASNNGVFFLRLKDARNFETSDIVIKGTGERGSFQKFEFVPSAHPQIRDVINEFNEFYLVNLSIATDFGRYEWGGSEAEIDIRNLQIDYH